MRAAAAALASDCGLFAYRDFTGLDSSIISTSGGGIITSIGDFLESLSRAILIGIMLVNKYIYIYIYIYIEREREREREIERDIFITVSREIGRTGSPHAEEALILRSPGVGCLVAD